NQIHKVRILHINLSRLFQWCRFTIKQLINQTGLLQILQIVDYRCTACLNLTTKLTYIGLEGSRTCNQIKQLSQLGNVFMLYLLLVRNLYFQCQIYKPQKVFQILALRLKEGTRPVFQISSKISKCLYFINYSATNGHMVT